MRRDWLHGKIKKMEVHRMERKTNNPYWCVEQIQEKIEDYKAIIRERGEIGSKIPLEIIINDLEKILYD